MSLSIEQRLRYCDCYMCSDPESATCVELQFIYMDYRPSEISFVIKKIKRKMLRRTFLIYMKCNLLIISTME